MEKGIKKKKKSKNSYMTIDFEKKKMNEGFYLHIMCDILCVFI